jgi:hypothetical protein
MLQVLCNKYAPGGGISRHNDGPLFEPLVGIVSMSGSATIHFWRDQNAMDTDGLDDAATSSSILLMPRSLLIFSHEAYTCYTHSVERDLHDHVIPSLANYRLLPQELVGQQLPRRLRVSLTVRRVDKILDEGSVLETDEARAERARRRISFEKGINDSAK